MIKKYIVVVKLPDGPHLRHANAFTFTYCITMLRGDLLQNTRTQRSHEFTRGRQLMIPLRRSRCFLSNICFENPHKLRRFFVSEPIWLLQVWKTNCNREWNLKLNPLLAPRMLYQLNYQRPSSASNFIFQTLTHLLNTKLDNEQPLSVRALRELCVILLVSVRRYRVSTPKGNQKK